MMNEYYLAPSTSSKILTTLKEIIHDILSKLHTFNTFKGKYNYYSKGVKLLSIIAFRNTIFKPTANNFIIVLNRRDTVENSSLNLVKYMKKKNRYVNSVKLKNNVGNISV